MARQKTLEKARKAREKALENARRARAKAIKIKREFRKHAVTAIIAAFGFLIALTWRDFISDSVNKIVSVLGVSDQLYLYKLVSAIIVTFIAIIGIMIVSKVQTKEPKDNA